VRCSVHALSSVHHEGQSRFSDERGTAKKLQAVARVIAGYVLTEDDEGSEWIVDPEESSDDEEEDDQDATEEDKTEEFFRGEQKKQVSRSSGWAIGYLEVNWLAIQVFQLCHMPVYPGWGTAFIHGITAQELRSAMFLMRVSRALYKDTIERVKVMEQETKLIFEEQMEKARTK
jgi:hypothetical protein